MLTFLLQAVFTALGLWLASEIVPGVEVLSTGSLIAAALLLGIVNALVRQWLPRLTQAIQGFGFDVLPSAGNVVLVRFPDERLNAQAADVFLHSRGLIVRPVGGYGLTDCLRITVGTEDQNRALLDALSEFAAS